MHTKTIRKLFRSLAANHSEIKNNNTANEFNILWRFFLTSNSQWICMNLECHSGQIMRMYFCYKRSFFDEGYAFYENFPMTAISCSLSHTLTLWLSTDVEATMLIFVIDDEPKACHIAENWFSNSLNLNHFLLVALQLCLQHNNWICIEHHN